MRSTSLGVSQPGAAALCAWDSQRVLKPIGGAVPELEGHQHSVGAAAHRATFCEQQRAAAHTLAALHRYFLLYNDCVKPNSTGSTASMLDHSNLQRPISYRGSGADAQICQVASHQCQCFPACCCCRCSPDMQCFPGSTRRLQQLPLGQTLMAGQAVVTGDLAAEHLCQDLAKLWSTWLESAVCICSLTLAQARPCAPLVYTPSFVHDLISSLFFAWCNTLLLPWQLQSLD